MHLTRNQLLKCYCKFINKFGVINSKAHFQHFIYESYILKTSEFLVEEHH